MPSITRSIALLSVLMDSLIIYPWLMLLREWPATGWEQTPLSFWSVLAIGLITESGARVAGKRNQNSNSFFLILPLLLMATLSVVRIDNYGSVPLWDVSGWLSYASHNISLMIAAFGFSLYMLWRGISAAQTIYTSQDVNRKFLIGLAVMVALITLWAMLAKSDKLPSPGVSIGLFAAAYFFIGLLGMALINLQTVREEMVEHEGVSTLLDRRWLSLLLGMSFVIVVLAIGLTSLFSFDLASALMEPLRFIAKWVLLGFIYAVLLPLGLVVGSVIFVVHWIISFIFGTPPQVKIKPPGVNELRKAAEGDTSSIISPDLIAVIKWTLLLIVACIITFLLAKAFYRRWKTRAKEDIDEFGESLFSWQTLKADIGSLFNALLGRFRKKKSIEVEPQQIPQSVQQSDNIERTFTIREIYQGLMWQGRSAGIPRNGPETPYEYEERLSQRFDNAPEIPDITKEYVEHRYGETPVEAERLKALNAAWRTLRSFMLRGNLLYK
ncbi:MAG: DUF4129 domain-containing protein [Dehalococcoidia bacterium]|nr:DUF4129 domain-containing protein [Dehalococcoidia bacterium]